MPPSKRLLATLGVLLLAPSLWAADFSESLPHIGGPEGYVGSKECQSCHEEQYKSWHRSFHRTMTQFASPESVRANFNHVVLTNDQTRFLLRESGGEYWVRMEKIGAGAAGGGLDVRMGLITGSHHMQVFWVPGDVGNTQVGFPFTWLIPEKRWVPRNSTFIRPPDTVHRAEVWNVVCSRCHATAIEPRVDGATRTIDTRAAELGISCEACHGPGKQHAELRLAARGRPEAPTAAELRAEIVQPKKIDPLRSSQVCGFCHSMKWIDRAEAWRDKGFRYRPGDDLEKTTPIISPLHVDAVAGLKEYLARNPDLLLDFFWPDGMIRVSGREYNGLIESPCHKGGKFSCLSCHSMHESDPKGLVSPSRTGNGACVQCHEKFGTPQALTAHTRHSVSSSGSDCYNCHMPYTTYGVLKGIRSHQVSSPSVAVELATGRPNACNLCHLDKSLPWTRDKLTEWYVQPRTKLPDQDSQIARSIQLALSGDAGQRALMAWHFGWRPALDTSGSNWVAAVLGQMLDDPYAAVRCVAERSLRAVGETPPTGYDFSIDPSARAPARPAVWTAWSKTSASSARNAGAINPGSPIRSDDLEAQLAAFEAWVSRRNERRLRLRE